MTTSMLRRSILALGALSFAGCAAPCPEGFSTTEFEGANYCDGSPDDLDGTWDVALQDRTYEGDEEAQAQALFSFDDTRTVELTIDGSELRLGDCTFELAIEGYSTDPLLTSRGSGPCGDSAEVGVSLDAASAEPTELSVTLSADLEDGTELREDGTATLR